MADPFRDLLEEIELLTDQVEKLKAERDGFVLERGLMLGFMPVDQIGILRKYLQALREKEEL